MAAQKRLSRELADIKQNPMDGMNVSLVNDSDMLKWRVLINGPAKTPYEGGLFQLIISMPNDYPFKPPVLNFETRIYHPNVSNDGTGAMCLGLLRSDQWKPNSKINTVLLFVRQLLQEPQPDDAVEQNIAAEFKNDKSAFEKNAKDWTKKHAKK